jgi:hypothetical protein
MTMVTRVQRKRWETCGSARCVTGPLIVGAWQGDSTSEEEFSLEEYEAQQAEKKAALAKYTNKGKIRTVQASAVSALQKADEEFWADQKKEDKHVRLPRDHITGCAA